MLYDLSGIAANNCFGWHILENNASGRNNGAGTNFSLFSEVATRVELCLFDEQGRETHIDLPEVDGFCWHGYLPGVEPGQRYGYRVHGPYDPHSGQRFNPHKLLIDPYAKAIEGPILWDRGNVHDRHARPRR